jgi:small multidrug resistance pump
MNAASDYRATLYRLVFSLAAIYNISFGLWASLWPQSFFAVFGMAPPNYPSIWQCLGMVIGLYGLLYAYAVWKLENARPIIAIGLAGKILGPIGWLFVVHAGEWPLRTFTLIAFNDLAWWLPFALFLLEGAQVHERVRNTAPFACAAFNVVAAVAMLLVLRSGTEVVPSFAARAMYIEQHAGLWRAGWAVWIAAASSLLAFYTWWGAWLPSRRWGIAACAIAIAGFACDLMAESLMIGWLPGKIETLAPMASLLTGGAANGLYTLAGMLLTVGTRKLRGPLRVWAWATWASGAALTAFTIAGSVAGITISTAVLMTLFCPWVAAFGWSLLNQTPQSMPH